MKIELREIEILEIVKNYTDNNEGGVVGYNGNLNIRPAYQREFVYKDKQRNAVIETILKGFPLNVMYWVDMGNDKYEILDGQQRTISICEYINNNFSVNGQLFHGLPDDIKEDILAYNLFIYVCSGDESEKLDWFKTINIAGVKLTDQELRNAIYTGTWLADAKRYFSKTSGPAYMIANKLVRGTANRQEYLETAIKWISDDNIIEYMGEHQHDENSKELWLYYQSVINWVNATFPKYYKEMKGINWGYLYNNYKNVSVDASRISELMKDESVTKKAGIFSYLVTGDEKYLNIRSFSENEKREAYERQQGICPKCNNKFEIDQMEADHCYPWSKGGKTEASNCEMLCISDNRKKSNK